MKTGVILLTCHGGEGYKAVVEDGGYIKFTSPVSGSSFSCRESDLVYMLLVERMRSDELAEEVNRLRKCLIEAPKC